MHGLDLPVVPQPRNVFMDVRVREVGALLDAGAVHGGRTARSHLLGEISQRPDYADNPFRPR